MAALLFLSDQPVRAEQPGDFLTRIARAYASGDRNKALFDLFFVDGMDEETLAMYETRIVGRMLGEHDAPTLALEPLPDGFDPVQVGNGYEYRPNLTLLGYVVIDGKTRAPYGHRGDRYYLAGMTRTLITDPAGPEQMLQMIVIGMDHPPIRFDGHCRVLLANGDRKRIALEDEGLTNKTMLVAGVRIEACELRNLSGRGAMMLRLLEGDDQIFDRRIEAPEDSISFVRPETDR